VHEAALLGRGQHRDRVRWARRHEVRALERIDGDVDLGRGLGPHPDLLADV